MTLFPSSPQASLLPLSLAATCVIARKDVDFPHNRVFACLVSFVGLFLERDSKHLTMDFHMLSML